MRKSTRLMTTSNKKKSLWIDSETDLSLASDNDSNTASSKSVSVETLTNGMTESSRKKCCLICSIVSSLSNVNCCPKHLALLATPSPAQTGRTMTARVRNLSDLECHCSKSKRHHRFFSLSVPSSKSQCRRNKRLATSTSSSTIQTSDFLLSSNSERSASSYNESRRRPATDRQQRSNNVRIPLSSSSITNNNNSRKRNINQTQSTIQNGFTREMDNQSTSSDLVELDSDSDSPRISLKRVIHVKDDNEELILTNSQITLNMAQATGQMVAQENIQPKILLKRVCLEQ